MRQAIRIAQAQRLTSRRARRDLGRWTSLLGPGLMVGIYLGLDLLPPRWTAALLLNDQPWAAFCLLLFGLGGVLVAPVGGLRLFGVREPGLLQTLPIAPAPLFGGLVLGQLAQDAWAAAVFTLPILAHLVLRRGVGALVEGFAGAALGFAAGSAASLGGTVLVTRHLRPRWPGRLGLVALLGGGPLVALVLIPSRGAAAASVLAAGALLAYVAGQHQYPRVYASQSGTTGSRPGRVLTYSRLRRVVPAWWGPARSLAVKDLVMLFRHPVTPWRAVLFLLSLPAFPWFRQWSATWGWGRPLDPPAAVAAYVIASAALLLGLEVYATAFTAESGRISLLLAAPVTPEAILVAKIAACQILPLAGTAVGVLVAGHLAHLTLAGYAWALLYSVPAVLGVGVVMVGLVAFTPEVGSVPEESPEALILEQVPLGWGMVALAAGAALLSVEILLLLRRPASILSVLTSLSLVAAECAAGWFLGRRGLRTLTSRQGTCRPSSSLASLGDGYGRESGPNRRKV